MSTADQSLEEKMAYAVTVRVSAVIVTESVWVSEVTVMVSVVGVILLRC